MLNESYVLELGRSFFVSAFMFVIYQILDLRVHKKQTVF